MEIKFKIIYHTVWGESLGVIISDKIVPLSTSDGKVWEGSADIRLPKGGLPLLYRYGVFREGNCIRQERNCMAHVIENVSQAEEPMLRDDIWCDEKRVAGVAIPVFSLRSEGSFGVGDFGDLKTLVDWAVKTGMKAVQILPINDTTDTGKWTDSYPYNSISVYALHPQYIDLRQLPALKSKKKTAEYEAKRKRLNALSQIDYEAVNEVKRAYLHDIYKQEGKKCLASEAFQTFYEANSVWLRPYAAFSVLRDTYGTSDYTKWPKYSTYSETEIADFTNAETESVGFYYFLQYSLHEQLLAVSDYARQNNVILKGDIPIGVCRTSVETWVAPSYFNMNGSAGAPPDTFSTNGQNWGFPTYNWEAMQADGLQWWLRRFRKMQEYFSAYRIDHILGFFRIWEIPTHAVHGLLGQFSPSLPMSPKEIESYGLTFCKEWMTEPMITDELLEQRIGKLSHYQKEQTEWLGGKDPVTFVKEVFLDPKPDGKWQMKPQFATQRQIEKFFAIEHDSATLEHDSAALGHESASTEFNPATIKHDSATTELKEAVYSLVSDVLFVEDHRTSGLYHPRISVQLDYVYTCLTEGEKQAFNHLYDDYFYRRHNQFWYDRAMQKLTPLIQATQMIVCGEDLGMVPDCVPWVMNALQILSLEIQRMPKEPGHLFAHVANYPVHSVCTTGTHDTETLRQWWTLDPNQTQRYWHEELGYDGPCPSVATPEVCARIIGDHLACPSLLCILPFQDWLSIDDNLRLADADAERINIPANPHHYWRYRMHISLEELLAQESFNNRIAKMIESANR